MSDGICNVADGDFVELKGWCGRDWRLSCKTLGQFAEIERFILARRGDPLATVLAWVAELPADARGMEAVEKQVNAAMRMHVRARFASQEEIYEYNSAPAGMGHRLWMAARQAHPELTLEQCTEIVLRASDDEIIRLGKAIDGADQSEQLKNSAGPAENGAGTNEAT